MKKRNYLDVAKDFVAEHHPKAAAVFIAGSMRRGEDYPNSDIDIVVIYKDEDLNNPYRDSLRYQNWFIENFNQNIAGNQYFLNKDYEGRAPILASMIMEGEMIVNIDNIGNIIRKNAIKVHKKGPKPFDKKEMERKIYSISDKIDDIEDNRPAHELYAVLCELYKELANFYLVSKLKWSGVGKGLIRALKKYDEDFMKEYQNAFEVAFKELDMKPVIDLSKKILKPHGGLQLENFKQYSDLKIK